MSGVSTNPGLYPGNPSLPKEVREKILSTFRHTLNLYQEGKLDDCLIGCDFILKMDPRFSPARRLLEKTRNPNAEVDIIELEAIVARTPARPIPISNADAEKLLVRAVESFNARDFDACIGTAEKILSALPGNVHATDLLEKARSRKQAQSAFEASRHRALLLLESRRYGDVARELEAMRSLDAEHPAVALLERRLEQATGSGGAPAGPAASPAMAVPSAAAAEPEPAGHWGAAAAPVEPAISFPSAAPAGGDGLDALSLDSLSLDPGSTAVAPPADFQAQGRGPLEPPPAAPKADRGSPGDLWTDSPEPLEERSEPVVTLPPPPRAPAAKAASAEDEASSEREIAHLLQLGDEAAERGDHQGAIEIWSRIFLIDINSVEAVTRIERTREAMTEGSRRAISNIEAGRAAFDAGDLDGARSAFLEALTISPNDPTAQSYLEKIEQRLGSAGPVPELPPDLEADLAAAGEPSAAREEAPSLPPSAKRRVAIRIPPKAVMVAAVFAVLVGIGAWLVLKQPKPPAAAPPAPVRAAGSMEKATAFFQEGKIPETIAELKKIRPADPDYDRAKQLLDSLARGGAEPQPAAAAPKSPPVGADVAGARTRAEQALNEKRYIDALKDFSAVSTAYQGDPGFAQEMSAASAKVTELTPAVKLYNDGEYETAIPVFWRIFQADRGNQDARSYLLRSYANQGITQLQNGLFEKARQSFDEALAIDPQDGELARHRKFAEKYRKGDLDLMGRIYVRHLPHRP